MTFDWDGFIAGHPRLERGDLRTNDFIELHGDALIDLHERLDAIEHSACIRRDRIVQAAMQNERGNYDELQSNVVKLEEWLKACHRNWVKESSGHHQAEYTLDKMRELGLIDEFQVGGQGGAAHPDLGPEVTRMVAEKSVQDMDLQMRVDEFVGWVQEASDPFTDGVGDTYYCIEDSAILLKLRALGLLAGGQGDAVHPDQNSTPSTPSPEKP